MSGADFTAPDLVKDDPVLQARAAELVRGFYGDDVAGAAEVLAALGLDES